MKRIVILVVLAGMFFSRSVEADTIVLKNGRKIKGDIVVISKEYFLISQTKGVPPQSYFIHEIKKATEVMSREEFKKRDIGDVVRNVEKYFTLKELGEEIALTYHLEDIDDLEQLSEKGILMHKLFWVDDSKKIVWSVKQTDLCDLPENIKTCEQNRLNYEHNKEIYFKLLETEDENLCQELSVEESLIKKCYHFLKSHLAFKYNNVSYCHEIPDAFLKYSCVTNLEKLQKNPKAVYKPVPIQHLQEFWGTKALPRQTVEEF